MWMKFQSASVGLEESHLFLWMEALKTPPVPCSRGPLSLLGEKENLRDLSPRRKRLKNPVDPPTGYTTEKPRF